MSEPPDDFPESLLSLGSELQPAQLTQEQRDRMRQRMLEQARRSGPEGTTTWLAADNPWIAIAPKVEIRQLLRDRLTGTHMSLVRMQPGGVIPAHIHEKEETFIILEGECHIGHHRLGTGDAHIASAGSWHDHVTTRSGVLVLLKGEYPYPGSSPPPTLPSHV
jgi:quercetin dioxygenase-like cupin family protein